MTTQVRSHGRGARAGVRGEREIKKDSCWGEGRGDADMREKERGISGINLKGLSRFSCD